MSNNFISIITVNYNGKQYIENFLNSLMEIEYPKDRYEIIVVDNGSSDGSIDLIETKFPTVKLIESKHNIGFGSGNNLGMKSAVGDLFLLINNDTVVTRDLLKQLNKCYLDLSTTKKTGAINCKLVLIDRYLELKLSNCSFIGFQLDKKAEGFNRNSFVFKHQTSPIYKETVLIPVNHDYHQDLHITASLNKLGKNGEVDITNFKTIKSINEEGEISITIPKSIISSITVDLIQNAGNFYFRCGHGRDRGTLTMNNTQFYEPDEGQYNKVEEIPGFCGGGVLINKKAIKDIGNFDPSFFMYYEDADLSFRMKNKKWKTFYCPDAVVRHIHSASSTEWSDFFIFNTERNRILLLFKHWPQINAISEWGKYLIRDSLLVPAYLTKTGNSMEAKRKFLTRFKINLSLIVPFISNILNKNRMSKADIGKLL